jgi:hypothetical protein
LSNGVIPNRLARHCFYRLFVNSFFECSGFSPELEKRGFDASFDIPCYLFREDGKMIWEAYGKFAANFVDEIYATDEQVKADTGLQKWAQETTEKAAINGFPKSFEDKQTLVKTLQTLGWISVNHAAVNFPQYDVSSIPLASRLEMVYQLPQTPHSLLFVSKVLRLSSQQTSWYPAKHDAFRGPG